MDEEKFWLITESNTGFTCCYSGYYRDGLPVFCMAIADSVSIASFDSAKRIYDVLIKVIPCEISLLENNSISKVWP